MSKFVHLTMTLAAVALASPAFAQSLTLEKLDVTGRDANSRDFPFNSADCQSAVIKLRISAVPTTATLLDFWRGSSCDQQATRMGSTKSCDYIPSPISQSTNGQMQIDKDTSVAALIPDCTKEGAEETYNIFVLGVTTTMSTDAPLAFGSFQVKLDTKPPDPPSGLSGGSGETAVGVNWTRSSDANVKEYNVYVDKAPAGSADADAGTSTDGCPASATLVAGGAAPTADPAALLRGGIARDVKDVTVDASGLGLDFGGKAVIAVAAVDFAGNVSALSNTTCITYVQTSGFWDAYRSANGGAAKDGTGCQIAATSRLGGATVLGSAVVALTVAIRSRRRRRGRGCN